MNEATPCLVAMGGGGFMMEPDNPRLDDYLLGLVARPRPRVLFVPTASGDRDELLVRFYAAFASRDCVASHLGLFRRSVADLRAHLLAQDLVYVGGGNTANMLAIWRAHGLDEALREAWSAGVVLCGLSAGSLCWFESGLTDSFGLGLEPLDDGLGLLPGSHCPHYDGELLRRPRYRELVGSGRLPGGLALDDGAAARFCGARLVECVSSRPGARAWRVEADGHGGAVETALAVRFLGQGPV